MRLTLLVGLGLLIVSGLTIPTHAKTWGPAKVQTNGFDRKAALDEIHRELAAAPDQATSRRIIDRFWLTWMTTPDEETAELLNRALRARGGFDLEKAMGFLNAIVEKHPDYAEGWNQRATIHFMQSRFEAALKDCEVTLALAPRHIGCLSGSAIILIRHLKRYELGRKFLMEAIKLHPWIYERVLLKEIPPSY